MLQAASLLITTSGGEELRGPHTGGPDDLLVGSMADVVESRDSDSEPESEGAAGQ